MEKQDIIKEMSKGNQDVAEVVAELLEDPDGARYLEKYVEFPKVILSPKELWRIYKECCNKDLKLFASTMDLLEDFDPGMVHANLQKETPIKFIERPFKIPSSGPDRRKCVEIIRKDFEKRYMKGLA